ncbi:MAG: NAD-dependent epimerase/dehydratase family protein [Candidatus Bipolaricaulota bacterium]
MRALVTGGTGFLGANVVRALLQEGLTVRVLARPGSDRRTLRDLDVEVVEGDLLDPASLRRAAAGCPLLFHMAAMYAFSAPRPEHVYMINVDGTRTALEAAEHAGVERVVYTSSVSALGLREDGLPANETTPVQPQGIIGHYKRSKYLAEQVALEFSRRLPVVIVNPSFPVGPWDVKPTPTGQVIVDFLNRKMPAYVDTGMNVVDAEDVGRGHFLAAERGRPGERYILGGENLSMWGMLGLLAEVSGLPAPKVRLPYAPTLALAYLNALSLRCTGRGSRRLTPETLRMSRHKMFFDPSKAVEELGFPQTPAREALAKAVRWFREHGYASGVG